MSKKSEQILAILKKHYPDVKCALNHNSAWQLLLATILSAQCTDVRVNQVTQKLFADYPTVWDIDKMEIENLKKYIHSAGFYNNKAKNIKFAASMIINKFGGEIPDNMEDLLTIPGVARKTANVVLCVWFKDNQGIAVDTHVTRLAGRLGLTENTMPAKIEKDLMKIFPRDDWDFVSLALIQHGREICTARNPKCKDSFMKEFCNCSNL
jgi:endonuclease III